VLEHAWYSGQPEAQTSGASGTAFHTAQALSCRRSGGQPATLPWPISHMHNTSQAGQCARSVVQACSGLQKCLPSILRLSRALKHKDHRRAAHPRQLVSALTCRNQASIGSPQPGGPPTWDSAQRLPWTFLEACQSLVAAALIFPPQCLVPVRRRILPSSLKFWTTCLAAIPGPKTPQTTPVTYF
jgi:hypothetical protein